MKRIKIKLIAAISVVLLVAAFAVSCIGFKVDYKVEDVTMQIDNTYDESNSSPLSIINSISSIDSFTAIFDFKFFNFEVPSGLEMFNDAYFKINDLIIVSYLGHEDSNVDISKITIKGNELFVQMRTSKSAIVYSKYTYKYVTISKNDTKDVSKYGYVIIS